MLFTTLGLQYLFWTFAIYTGRLLHGRLRRQSIPEGLVILRNTTISCEY